MRIGARHHRFAGFNRLAQAVENAALKLAVLGSNVPKLSDTASQGEAKWNYSTDCTGSLSAPTPMGF
jgi:hypothetical protein